MRNVSIAVLILGVAFAAVLVKAGDSQAPDKMSFAPLFQIFGRATQGLERGVGALLLNDDMSEWDLGQKMKANWIEPELAEEDQKRLEYLRKILPTLLTHKRKEFDYEILLSSSPIPNAMALPGGVVIITKGLLETLKSESELASVIAHEIGHIELSHCRESVKFRLASERLNVGSLGELADFANALLVRHSYSKTQEDEADEYAFTNITSTEYDPRGVGDAFLRLRQAEPRWSGKDGNIFRDYFSSHPPLEDRENKFNARAETWWRSNTGTLRFIGQQNLTKLIPVSEQQLD